MKATIKEKIKHKGALKSMWTVIYVAQSMDGASRLKKRLSDQGVLVKTNKIGRSKNSDGLYEILVPETEVEDACSILEQIGFEF